MTMYDISGVRGGWDLRVGFKVDIKRDYMGDIREYFKESIFLAFKGKSDGLGRGWLLV